MGVTFTNINEKGKFQVTDSSKFPEPLKQLNELLNGREFLELIEYVTGMPAPAARTPSSSAAGCTRPAPAGTSTSTSTST